VECLLAGMALGCVVIPIDPLAPSGRVQSIFDEIKPKLTLNEVNTEKAESSPLWDGSLPENTETAALILMTSGSTGTPKGIVLSHKNISAFVDWAAEIFSFSHQDRWVSIAPMHFDLSMLDIYAGLSAGGHVYLPSEKEIAFAGSMAKIFETHKPTILYAVPSMLQIFQRFAVFRKTEFPQLRWLLFAGEVYPIEALKDLMNDLPDARFSNLFGPTETNVITWHEVTSIKPDWQDRLCWGTGETDVWKQQSV